MAISSTSGPLLPVVRAYYGLSQVELAQFLSVSRGLVALVETRRRVLPPDAAARLKLLSGLMNKQAESPSINESASEPAVGEAMQLHQRKCLRQASGLRQELEKLQLQATQYQRRLSTLPVLSGALGKPPADAGLRAWLDKMAAQAQYGLADCGLAAQSLLTVRIAALEFEAAEVSRQLRAVVQNPS
jgi:transcriptional regulator with XRE-family HTH domain